MADTEILPVDIDDSFVTVVNLSVRIAKGRMHDYVHPEDLIAAISIECPEQIPDDEDSRILAERSVNVIRFDPGAAYAYSIGHLQFPVAGGLLSDAVGIANRLGERLETKHLFLAARLDVSEERRIQ